MEMIVRAAFHSRAQSVNTNARNHSRFPFANVMGRVRGCLTLMPGQSADADCRRAPGRHSSGVNNALSLSQEKDADIAAAEWVLDGISVDSPMFVKRMLGIVQGFLLTTAMGLYGGSLGGNTHPFSYDRLSSLLNRFLGNTPHVTKDIAFAILDLHFQNSGRTLKKTVFPGPEEALEALCDQLAEEAHAKKCEVVA